MFKSLWIGAALAALLFPIAARADEPVTVFAAASLRTALDAAAAKFQASGHPAVSISYGGSLTLARQIVAGAPADLFASADEVSMDEAEKAHVLREGTRVDLLSNHLVLVAPKDSSVSSLALEPAALNQSLGEGKLVTGDVSTVPVGKYARAALTKLGLWATAEPHLAMTPDVRTALAFVARGEAALGIVYATDAAAEPKVKVVASFPDDSHPPIRYPFALIASSRNPEAEKLLDYLKSAEGRAIFAAEGFGAP